LGKTKKKRLGEEREVAAPRGASESSAETSRADKSKSIAKVLPQRRNFRAFYLALISFAMLWIAMPPVGAGWLAWIALIPLMWLIETSELPRKSIRQIWFASWLYFLATFYFLPIPFWALWIGWAILTFYLSLYVPMFVYAARTMRHRFGIPTIIATPVAWCGLEWVRGTFATGFGMAFLSHSQYKYPLIIQIADTFGAYGVSFAIVMFASGIAVATLPSRLPRLWTDYELDSFKAEDQKTTPQTVSGISRIIHCAAAIILLAVIFLYSAGSFSISATTEEKSDLKIVLVQTSIDTILKPSTDEQRIANFKHRRKLTLEARQKWKDIDLIVWPESSLDAAYLLADDTDQYTVAQNQQDLQSMFFNMSTDPRVGITKSVPMLVGTGSVNPEKELEYNSALLFDDRGVVTNHYHKIHRVMIGEYFPVLDRIPLVKEWIKGFSRINAGTDFKDFQIADVHIAPSICFETMVPHLIRKQVNTLSEQGREPDVLVNITNDGWFLGTSCLDLHLACNVYRAVEMRKPNLVCANTGFSAEIDEFGQIRKVGPRRKSGLLVCNVKPNAPGTKKSAYRSWGAWVPMGFGLLTLLTLIVATRESRKPL